MPYVSKTTLKGTKFSNNSYNRFTSTSFNSFKEVAFISPPPQLVSPTGSSLARQQPRLTFVQYALQSSLRGGGGHTSPNSKHPLNSEVSRKNLTVHYEVQPAAGAPVVTSTKHKVPMTKSYALSLSKAPEFTCHRIDELKDAKAAASATANSTDPSNTNVQIDFCGSCHSCQIVERLNSLKQWFDRAGQLTVKKFMLGLVSRINNTRIYTHLNDLLKPLSESKDIMYARNRFLPSCNEDQSKLTNNRCVDTDYIQRQMLDAWNWYATAPHYVKLNFVVSLLNKCDQPVVHAVTVKVKSILGKYEAMSSGLSDNLEIYAKFNDDDSDAELVCEAYDEYDEVDSDNEVNNIIRRADDFNYRSSRHVDFISSLLVSKYWYQLVREVHKASFLKKIRHDDIMLLKGISSKACNPRYASNTDVKVPNLYPGSNELMRKPGEPEAEIAFKTECNWINAYAGFQTRNVVMEERNVFCGPYNVMLLKEKRDPHRVIHLNGPNLVAYGSFDKKIRFIDIKLAAEKNVAIQGHAGSIKCIYICEPKNLVVTGSFDTSIRCWSIETNKCIKILQGHQQTVNCVSMYDHEERIVSGSNDNTCRVWNMNKKKCWRIFKHSYAINCVAISDILCVTGGVTGRIKVFSLLDGKLIKTIVAHQGLIKGIKFDKWHIISCGMDGYALVYSTQGKHKKCIIAMRHPKEVLCIEMQYLRAITGAADGKIRIWNLLNGECIRVVRGNSKCDPVLSLSIVDNRLLINTDNNVLLMEFERIQYEYNTTLALEATEAQREADVRLQGQLRKPKTYSAIRASRSELIGTPNVKLFGDDRKSSLGHSARPLSGRNLKEAQILNSLTSKAQNIARNSAGHVSDLALERRQHLLQAINATVASKTSISMRQNNYAALSNDTSTVVNAPKATTESRNEDENEAAYRNIDEHRETLNQLKELEVLKDKPMTLMETKFFLREQLKEIKENAQMSEEARIEKLKANASEMEMKSCVECHQIHVQYQRHHDIGMTLVRPTSSPSKVDTKTKIRLRQRDLDRVNALKLDPTIEDHLNEQLGEQPVHRAIKRPQTQHGTRNVQFNDNDNDSFNDDDDESDSDETKGMIVIKPEMLVTKLFESREHDHETNSKMHPTNIKSKLPNQKIISSIRPATASPGGRFSQLARSKSARLGKGGMAALSSSPPPPLVPILFNRPKTPVAKLRPKTAMEGGMRGGDTDHGNGNKLMSGSRLNLMTYSEVDNLINSIVQSKSYNSDYERAQDERNKELYRKLWLLKSKGEYHGSLLAQTRSIAPEIRE